MKRPLKIWLICLTVAACAYGAYAYFNGDQWVISHYEGVVYRVNVRTGVKEESTPDGWKRSDK
jgi:hypothetical protein